MPKEFGRNLRVAKLIKEELATLIQEKFPLKQYGLVTLTNVDLSPDLKNSKIYFTSLNNKKANSEITIELNQNAGHFRYEVSKILTSKTVPSLCFKYDQSMERVQRLNTIFELVNTQREKKKWKKEINK